MTPRKNRYGREGVRTVMPGIDHDELATNPVPHERGVAVQGLLGGDGESRTEKGEPRGMTFGVRVDLFPGIHPDQDGGRDQGYPDNGRCEGLEARVTEGMPFVRSLPAQMDAQEGHTVSQEVGDRMDRIGQEGLALSEPSGRPFDEDEDSVDSDSDHRDPASLTGGVIRHFHQEISFSFAATGGREHTREALDEALISSAIHNTPSRTCHDSPPAFALVLPSRAASIVV